MKRSQAVSQVDALIDSSPLRRLGQTWRNELQLLEKFSPSSDVTNSRRIVIKELEAALRESERSDVFVSVERAASLTNRPESSIRRWCDNHGSAIGAVKLDGRWSIEWFVFEPWIRGHRKDVEGIS